MMTDECQSTKAQMIEWDVGRPKKSSLKLATEEIFSCTFGDDMYPKTNWLQVLLNSIDHRDKKEVCNIKQGKSKILHQIDLISYENHDIQKILPHFFTTKGHIGGLYEILGHIRKVQLPHVFSPFCNDKTCE